MIWFVKDRKIDWTKRNMNAGLCEANVAAWLAKREIKPFDYLFQRSAFVWISFQSSMRIPNRSTKFFVLKRRKISPRDTNHSIEMLNLRRIKINTSLISITIQLFWNKLCDRNMYNKNLFFIIYATYTRLQNKDFGAYLIQFIIINTNKFTWK